MRSVWVSSWANIVPQPRTAALAQKRKQLETLGTPGVKFSAQLHVFSPLSNHDPFNRTFAMSRIDFARDIIQRPVAPTFNTSLSARDRYLVREVGSMGAT